jgi:hypothetical protein
LETNLLRLNFIFFVNIRNRGQIYINFYTLSLHCIHSERKGTLDTYKQELASEIRKQPRYKKDMKKNINDIMKRMIFD